MKYEKNKTTRTTIRLSPDQAKHLEAVQQKEGIIPSEYVRRLIDKDMEIRSKK